MDLSTIECAILCTVRECALLLLMVGLIIVPIIISFDFMMPGVLRLYKTKITDARGAVYVDMSKLCKRSIIIRKFRHIWHFTLIFEHSYNNWEAVTLCYDSLKDAEEAVDKLTRYNTL